MSMSCGEEEEEEWAERGEEMKPLALCHTCCVQTSSLPVGREQGGREEGMEGRKERGREEGR